MRVLAALMLPVTDRARYENDHLLHRFDLKTISFYQDRLGTNIGKSSTQKRDDAFSYSLLNLNAPGGKKSGRGSGRRVSGGGGGGGGGGGSPRSGRRGACFVNSREGGVEPMHLSFIIYYLLFIIH